MNRRNLWIAISLLSAAMAASCRQPSGKEGEAASNVPATANSPTPIDDGPHFPISLEGVPSGMIIEKNVMVAMRDGVHLATDTYRPGDGKPAPVVLLRTPYGSETKDYTKMGKFYVKHGYALAIQNCRGKYDSEGDWYGKRNEAQDGSDTITWLGTRPWSTGKVGMTGESYMGMVQYLVADQQNQYLKAMVPQAAPVTLGRDLSDYDHTAVYSAREAESFDPIWMLLTDGRVNQEVSASSLFHDARNHLPMTDYPKILGRRMIWWPFVLNQRYGFWEEYYLRAAAGEWSKPLDMQAWWNSYEERYKRINVPMLHISGWYDCCGEQLIKTFELTRKLASDPAVRNNQQLMMGPWSHALGRDKEGQYNFGPSAKKDMDEISVHWFDHWLKGEDNGAEKDPTVRVFVQGENRWREATDWPIPGTQFTKFYLHSKGQAQLHRGGGTLSDQAPTEEMADHYTYDPGNPTPGVMAQTDDEKVMDRVGPWNMDFVENRDDALVYTTPVLTKPVEVTGPLTATVYIATSAPSTDLIVRLLDVHPDGKAFNIFYTYIASPYRTHWSKNVEKAADGTKIVKAEVALPPTSVLFQNGHRMRVEIVSAAAPTYRGLNVEPGTEATATHWNIAKQTIYHDGAHPSHIVLPIVPR
jgi:putative CocE/NonD family hydrolase